MATLTLTIGPITASRTATNVIVAALIDDYIAAYIDPLAVQPANAQERADWFMDHLVRHIIEAANGQNVRAAVNAADAAANEAIRTRTWP